MCLFAKLRKSGLKGNIKENHKNINEVFYSFRTFNVRVLVHSEFFPYLLLNLFVVSRSSNLSAEFKLICRSHLIKTLFKHVAVL